MPTNCLAAVRKAIREHSRRTRFGSSSSVVPERYRPLLAIAVYTGMRIQEILGLAWGDIDFREGVIRVRAQLSRGTKRPGAPGRSQDEGRPSRHRTRRSARAVSP